MPSRIDDILARITTLEHELEAELASAQARWRYRFEAGKVRFERDVAATHAGHWRFDPSQTLPVRLWGLPVEELGFFVVIPLAGLLTYEAVGVVMARHRARRSRGVLR